MVGTIIYAGTSDGVFLSTNNGTSWTAVYSGLTINNTSISAGLSSLVESGANLFAGTCYGVFLSTNNGANWTAINSGLNINNGIPPLVISLAVRGKNIFAGTYFGVYLSTNNGKSWNAFNTGMPKDAYVYSFVQNENTLFAGTARGIWRLSLSEFGTE
jgi:hypothetical protein